MTQTSTDSLTAADLARMERLPLAEDIPALLAALRATVAERDEARALVAALVNILPRDANGEYFCCHPDPWDSRLHTSDCAWDAARRAVKAWEGESDG